MLFAMFRNVLGTTEYWVVENEPERKMVSPKKDIKKCFGGPRQKHPHRILRLPKSIKIWRFAGELWKVPSHLVFRAKLKWNPQMMSPLGILFGRSSPTRAGVLFEGEQHLGEMFHNQECDCRTKCENFFCFTALKFLAKRKKRKCILWCQRKFLLLHLFATWGKYVAAGKDRVGILFEWPKAGSSGGKYHFGGII